jgi:hypothetical protein
MKKMLTLVTLIGLAFAPLAAEAANEQLAERLVSSLYKDPTTLTPNSRAKDPAKRDAYYRSIAVDYYADRYSEIELTDLVGFFSTPAGARLLKSQPKIEHEVLAVAFSEALDKGATLPAASQTAADDPRAKLAAQLMKSPYFENRIETVASQYEVVRGGFQAPAKKPSSESLEKISALYIDRYARRFGDRLLQEIVTFYGTKLGTKFSMGQVELPKKLEKAAEDFSG